MRRERPLLEKVSADFFPEKGIISKITREGELLEAPKSLVINFGIVVFKLIKIEAKGEFVIACWPRAVKAGVPLVAHPDMFPNIAVILDGHWEVVGLIV